MPKMLLLMPTLVTMTLASGFQLARYVGNLQANAPNHNWLVASYIVVGSWRSSRSGCSSPRT